MCVSFLFLAFSAGMQLQLMEAAMVGIEVSSVPCCSACSVPLCSALVRCVSLRFGPVRSDPHCCACGSAMQQT